MVVEGKDEVVAGVDEGVFCFDGEIGFDLVAGICVPAVWGVADLLVVEVVEHLGWGGVEWNCGDELLLDVVGIRLIGCAAS